MCTFSDAGGTIYIVESLSDAGGTIYIVESPKTLNTNIHCCRQMPMALFI